MNVFIETHRGIPTTAKGKTLLKPLEADLRKMLAAHRNKGAPRGGGVLSKRNFIAASVPLSELDKLEKDPRIAFVQPSEGLVFRLPQAERKSRAPARRAVGPRAASADGSDVIIGIVDVGGFIFAHPDFVDGRNGTRSLRCRMAETFRAAPKKFGLGAKFTEAHMDQAIAAAEIGALPATMLERQSQMTPGSHGTHVASIAAGASGVCSRR